MIHADTTASTAWKVRVTTWSSRGKSFDSQQWSERLHPDPEAQAWEFVEKSLKKARDSAESVSIQILKRSPGSSRFVEVARRGIDRDQFSTEE